MNKIILLAILFFILYSNSYSQTLAPGCSTALPFCAGTASSGLSFPNSTNVANAGNYSCLGSQPNPAWYYLQISQSGNLNFTIRQTNFSGSAIDVDFIAWGPFVAPSCGISNLNASTQVGCSYSSSATENFTISNAISGQYYIILMTNFSNQPGYISLVQTGGMGATSCDIICPLTIAGGEVSDCRDNILTANYLNSSQVGTTFTWTYQSSPTAPVTTIPSISGPNFIAGPPRSNTSTRTTLAYGVGTYCVTARSPGCSSTQSAVCTSIFNGVSAPTGPPFQSLSSTSTLANISVVGSNIVWYATAANAASGTNPLPLSQLVSNTTYYATQTINGCTSTSSLAVTITTLSNLDIELPQFDYYPNPVTDILNITSSKEIMQVTVFNILGQELVSKKINTSTTQINMSSYIEGFYFVQIITNNFKKLIRIIKK